MRNGNFNLAITCLALSAMLVVFTGCKKEEASQPAAGAEKGKVKNTVQKNDPAVDAILAKADAVDGNVDKIVSKCASCSLGMDGSAAHALKVGSYKMHFCSADCKEGFSENTKESILALNIPGD